MGKVDETEARLAILLQLDQVAVDLGSWTLASELSLEPPVPLHSFRLHESKEQELIYSRLLDARRAEIALHHLRDQVDFIEMRERLSKARPGQDTTATAEEKPESELLRAKAKAMAKGGRKKGKGGETTAT